MKIKNIIENIIKTFYTIIKKIKINIFKNKIVCAKCRLKKPIICKGLCRKCYQSTKEYKEKHKMSQRIYYTKNKEYYDNYAKENKQVIKEKQRQKYDSDEEYRQETKKHGREYNRKNYTTKNISTKIKDICPICKEKGTIKLIYKYNKRLDTKTSKGVMFQHYTSKGFGKTCYVSTIKYPKYKYYIGLIK